MSDTVPPPVPDSGATPPPAAPVPAAAPRSPGSATTLIWRRPDAATLRGALIAVLVAWGIEIVYQVLYVIEDISWSLNDGPSALGSTFVDFLYNGVLRSLFFFGPAFVALWLLLPVVKESTLWTTLKRAAVAGVAGLAGLLLFGLAEAIVDITQYGFYFGYFSVTWLWFPIVIALGFTVQLLVGATVSWIRAGRVPAAPVAATPTA